jgi:hypothetical protein
MQLGISFQRQKTSGNRYSNDVRFWCQEKVFFFFFLSGMKKFGKFFSP